MKKYHDWKDVANTYYEKSLSLTVLLALFAFLVTPEIKVKARDIKIDKQILVEEYIPEIEEPIKPPEEQQVQDIEIVFDEIGEESEEEDMSFVSTIDKTSIDMFEEKKAPPRTRKPTPTFVMYEDPPVLVKQVNPEYPDTAKELEIEGNVVLKIEVFEDGSVGEVIVLKSLMSGPGGLDEAAVNAAKQFEYTPAKFQGEPVAVWVEVPLNFTLE